MTKVLLGAVSLLILSCAGSPVSQEANRLVPLIKAERYDEAGADPELLAPSFVAALRELKAEGADPKRIVRVADFFFEHYPFCIKDLPIDEAVFEAVAEIHYESNLKLTSPIPSCRQVELCETLDDLIQLLEGWHDEHLDGDRCARRILDITRDARREGMEVRFGKYRVRDPNPWNGDDYLSDLLRKVAYPFGRSPCLPQIAFQVARLDGYAYQRRRHEAWCDRWDLTSGGRWKRLFHARLVWLGSLRQEPKVYEGGYGALLASKFDPRLAELGRALDDFVPFMHLRDSRPKAPKSILPAARALVRAGRGTPFADVARLGGVMYSQDVDLPDEAEAWFREQRKDFDQPLRAAYALLYMADPRTSDRSGEVSIQFAREAFELDPRGSSAISALALWGDWLHAVKRDAEAIERLESAVARGEAPLGYFEDEDADFARGAAGRLLGELLLEQGKWSRAFEVIRDWDLYTTCGTTQSDYDWRYASMALCLEKLGRAVEACEFHWKAASAHYQMKREGAEKVFGAYALRGRLADLRALVRERVTGIESAGKKVETDSGLKWLADELGVPIK